MSDWEELSDMFYEAAQRKGFTEKDTQELLQDIRKHLNEDKSLE